MPPQDRLKALGQALIARRASFDPTRFRTRPGWVEYVNAESGLSKRVIIDIETGARDTYRDETLTALESLYRLQPGALRAALTGAPLVADDGTILGPSGDPRDRYVAEERTHRLTGQVQRIVRDLEADTAGLPDDVAEEMIQRAMDNAENQARLMLETERRRWQRRQEQGEPSADGDQT
ncbi:hypothetical protein NE857_31395 [Nocardiopsis exhalans]|uniref:Uncharacterized protein n=1 Tax=Nocardiopsis exhalans TaxID=163604 RepID=A0ABY5D5Q0_9ACTN|nr:hypothetical protein [Nocardiopsis exhalans]USY19684.1 hypothetical protein NE857_31395 [Nocardiopsis exhalans]